MTDGIVEPHAVALRLIVQAYGEVGLIDVDQCLGLVPIQGIPKRNGYGERRQQNAKRECGARKVGNVNALLVRFCHQFGVFECPAVPAQIAGRYDGILRRNASPLLNQIGCQFIAQGVVCGPI